MKKLKEIVFVGPFPLPYGGISVLNNEVYNFFKKSDNWVINNKIDTSKEKNIISLLNILKKTISSERKLYFIQVNGSISFIRELLLIIFLKLKNQKVVIHLHASIKRKLINFPFNDTKFLNRFFINLLISKTDSSIFISEHILNDFKILISEKNILKCTSIENFIDCNKFVKRKIKSNDQINILYIGRLSRDKGIEQITDILPYFYKNHKNISFHLAGSNLGLSKNSMDILTQFEGKNVVIYPPIFNEDKIKFFTLGDIFIYPSHHEVFSVTLIEAMAATLPIVTTKVGINEKFLKEDENCYFMDIGNSEELKNKIIRLVENKCERMKMGNNNAVYALKYDRKNAMDQFQKTFQNVFDS